MINSQFEKAEDNAGSVMEIGLEGKAKPAPRTGVNLKAVPLDEREIVEIMLAYVHPTDVKYARINPFHSPF